MQQLHQHAQNLKALNEILTQVWMPDTFFRNERFGRMHNVLVPNLYVRIYADGLVLFR